MCIRDRYALVLKAPNNVLQTELHILGFINYLEISLQSIWKKGSVVSWAANNACANKLKMSPRWSAWKDQSIIKLSELPLYAY